MKAEEDWAYVSYHTANIGDDIQALAARQFLPSTAMGIDRDFLAVHEAQNYLKIIMNGWFLHTANNFWCRPDLAPPPKSWPPAAALDPLIISLHIDPSVEEIILSQEGVQYLKSKAPIGARDIDTLNRLRKKGIESYFSGCLTLTLNRTSDERGDSVYAVDVSKDMLQKLKDIYGGRLEECGHVRPLVCLLRPDQRLKFAQRYLDAYQQAAFVVTRRLHAAMPCLAFQTPVFVEQGFLKRPCKSGRFSGLIELTHHGDLRQMQKGDVSYDLAHPQSNPNSYLPIRNVLIEKVKGWINSGT